MPRPSSPARIIYLHGFASSPGSYKAVRFVERLAQGGLQVEVPDLNEGDFCGLTLSRQVALLERLTRGQAPGSVALIGSSMGAYAISLFAARSDAPAALVLMAPAFDFIRRWTERLGPEVVGQWQARGTMPVWHFQYERMLPIGFQLAEDARAHPPFPEVKVPTLIFHGKNDETVEAACSERYAAARQNARLVLLDSDHGMGDVIEVILDQAMEFLEPWLGGVPLTEPGC